MGGWFSTGENRSGGSMAGCNSDRPWFFDNLNREGSNSLNGLQRCIVRRGCHVRGVRCQEPTWPGQWWSATRHPPQCQSAGNRGDLSQFKVLCYSKNLGRRRLSRIEPF